MQFLKNQNRNKVFYLVTSDKNLHNYSWLVLKQIERILKYVKHYYRRGSELLEKCTGKLCIKLCCMLIEMHNGIIFANLKIYYWICYWEKSKFKIISDLFLFVHAGVIYILHQSCNSKQFGYFCLFICRKWGENGSTNKTKIMLQHVSKYWIYVVLIPTFFFFLTLHYTFNSVIQKHHLEPLFAVNTPYVVVHVKEDFNFTSKFKKRVN